MNDPKLIQVMKLDGRFVGLDDNGRLHQVELSADGEEYRCVPMKAVGDPQQIKTLPPWPSPNLPRPLADRSMAGVRALEKAQKDESRESLPAVRTGSAFAQALESAAKSSGWTKTDIIRQALTHWLAAPLTYLLATCDVDDRFAVQLWDAECEEKDLPTLGKGGEWHSSVSTQVFGHGDGDSPSAHEFLCWLAPDLVPEPGTSVLIRLSAMQEEG